MIVDPITYIKNRMVGVIKFSKNLIYSVIKGQPLALAFYCDIDISKLDRSVYFSHAYGVILGAPEQIGKNCTIYQNVTIGTLTPNNPVYPVLENDVSVGAGAVILGNIRIGQGAKIGANSVILADVPEGVTAVGVWK